MISILLDTGGQAYELDITGQPGEPDENWGREGASPGADLEWQIVGAKLATPDHVYQGRELRDFERLGDLYRVQIEEKIRLELRRQGDEVAAERFGINRLFRQP